MSKLPKKVAVIGIDCAVPKLMEQHIAEGHLPTLKRVIEGGTFAENCLVPFPTITPPNWATIATGATIGTHGITDFHVHKSGDPLDPLHCPSAFDSGRIKAELIWDAADKAGKKCIVLNYPGAWPSNMKNGIVVGGAGLAVSEYREGHYIMGSSCSLCSEQLITNGHYPEAIRGEFKDAENWVNVPQMGEEPLEMQAQLNFPVAKEKPSPTHWFVLARKAKDDNYGRITLSPTKDFKDAFCTLSPGDWSSRVVTKIKLADGGEREVFFRCKLLELSEDAADFRLLISALEATSGWSSPPEVAEELNSEEGITGVRAAGLRGYVYGWFEIDTYAEMSEFYAQWHADAATTLIKKYEWDGFFMHFHQPDWIYHLIMTDMDPNLNKDENRRREAWAAHLKVHQAMDKMLGQIISLLDKDTLVILISDHGAVPDGPAFNPYNALIPAGLAVLHEKQTRLSPDSSRKTLGLYEEVDIWALAPDKQKSKAIPLQTCYVYINLKERDEGGIVDPRDYEKVQEEIINAFYAYVDPNTGKRPVALALSKRDARILGLHGDDIGDVVYAVHPWASMQHGSILPTAEWGIGSLKGLFVLNGPGIKKGHRLQRTIGLQDMVPTICYLLDWPIPEQAEGAVLYQAFKDPNFKQKEILKLKEALARMETALAHGQRQPWDKHECA